MRYNNDNGKGATTIVALPFFVSFVGENSTDYNKGVSFMRAVSEYFGCMVFDDKVMQERLSPETYALMKRTIQDGRSLNLSVANAVAAAMKDWAVEHGATHYTH